MHSLRCGIVMLLALSIAATPALAQRKRGRGKTTNTAAKQSVAPAGNSSALDTLIAVTAEGSTETAIVEQVRQRLDKDVSARNRQRTADGKEPLPEPKSGVPRAMVDLAHFGVHHGNGTQQRFLALHLLLDNPTAEPLVIARDGITTKLDGEAKPLVDPAEGFPFSFQYGTQYHNLQNQKPPAEVKTPANGASGAWLLYTGLPMTSDVPPISVDLRTAKGPLTIDVTESQRALLQLDIAALGPRRCLRMLTMRGMLNSINVQSLVNDLERLTNDKITRYVVGWSPDALPPEQNAVNWLVQSATQLGTGRPVMEQFPMLPAQIREFHLVRPGANDAANQPNVFSNVDHIIRSSSSPHVHKSAADAVSAALKTAFLALPANELVEEIQSGHELTRVAALKHGASRLNASHLPFLLERLNDPNADLRTAAVRALSHFGEPAALDALVTLARKPADPLCGTAIESLAGSRYSVAQTRLLALIREDNPELKQQVMQVLAKYPRPQWSEVIYSYVTDPKEKLPIEGIRALLKVGHPQLVDVLETCLKSSDKALRDLAFPILAQRSDARSEALATEYALAELATRVPDGSMNQFLQRIKSTRAIPLLLKHLDSAPDKASILNLLAQIGGDDVGDVIAERYPNFKQSHEKGAALNALSLLHHAKFRPLAGEALLTSESNMIQIATQGLMQEGGPEATQLLIAALEKQSNNLALHHICNALGNLGSSEARAALLKARDSDNAERRNGALNALQYLRQRSPGYQYIYQAQHHGLQKQWKEALDFYNMSLEIDPELPEAYAGRASVRQRLGEAEDSAKDFEKAYELDPYNELAIPGLAAARAQSGKIDEALKILDRGRERYKHNSTFIYNTACVYAQAHEYFQKHEDAPDREQQQAAYRKKAIEELQQATSKGFADFNTMLEDPDLKSLRDDPEFKKLIGNRPQPMPEDAAEPDDAVE